VTSFSIDQVRTAACCCYGEENRHFYVPRPSFFVCPGDAPVAITQNVAWMKRQFSACQTPRSMYLSIFNNFRVIRCLSQCGSTKIAIIYHILVSHGDAPGAVTLNVVWIKKNSMLTNCFAACTHLTITVSQIERDIGRKSSFFSYSLAFDAPVRGFPSEYRHPVWHGKTRMAWLYPTVKKIQRYLYSFWRNSRTWRTHR